MLDIIASHNHISSCGSGSSSSRSRSGRVRVTTTLLTRLCSRQLQGVVVNTYFPSAGAGPDSDYSKCA